VAPERTRNNELETIAVAAMLFASVFVLRFAAGEVDDGFAFLYALPVALVGVRLGRTAGLVAGAIAFALLVLWAVAEDPGLSIPGYVVRGALFLLVGGLIGHMADGLHDALMRAEVGARHFELSDDMFSTVTFAGQVVDLNGSWSRALGWTPEEIRACPFLDLVHAEDLEGAQRQAARLVAGLATVKYTARFRTRDGECRWLELSASADAERGVFYVAARDATDRVLAELGRAEAQQRFRSAFEDSQVGMAIVGVHGADEGRVLEANEALAAILGLTHREAVGSRPLNQLAGDVSAVADKLAALSSGIDPVHRADVELVRRDGSRAWVDLTSSMVRDGAGRPLYRLTQLIDVTARKESEERLRDLARRDPLTGVHNRRHFSEELGRELELARRRGSRGAILLLDVDHLKSINDTLGHQAGDDVIVAVADALSGRVRTGDVVARIGGDEFAVLLRRVDERQATAVADGVVAAVRDRASPRFRSGVRPTVSVGVAMIGPDTHLTPEELLAEADGALYEAKSDGRDRIALHRPPERRR
jgi:diguanylate cyclase (GGDEF)-like protein/PAS domain S-box-containing protein